MKNLKFLKGVIFLISVFVLLGLAGKAHALAFRCCSSLYYYAELKGSPDTILRINIVNMNVRSGCFNLNDNSEDCKAGDGNSGSFVINATPESSGVKTQGIVYISGHVDLSKYDNHFDESELGIDAIKACYLAGTCVETPRCSSTVTTNCHQHICYPLDNPNKVEIPFTVYIPSLDVYYDVVNATNNKIKYSAHQICTYDGQIDPTTCEPPHYDPTIPDPQPGTTYTCSEEQIINK
jgi:hypothetical protein